MYAVNLDISHFPAQRDIATRDITIGGLLRETAGVRPDSDAVVEISQDGKVSRRCTYSELLSRSENLALRLSTHFSFGERVTVWSPNSLDWVLLEYACAFAGLVLVTANPALQARELRYVLEQSGSVGLFLVKEFRGTAMSKIGSEVANDISAIREVIDIENLSLFECGPLPSCLPSVESSSPAMIQYTSGTTGFPKGAVLDHRGLVNNARFYASRCGVTQETIWLNIMPLFHTSGCGMVTLGCLYSGCTMVLVCHFDSDIVLDHLESFEADMILGVPTMILSLLDCQHSRPRDLSSLKLVSCGGSMVSSDLVKRVQTLMGSQFSTLYGQTEYCPVITQHHLSDTIVDICNTTGQPVSQTEVSIRSVSSNTTVSIDEVGEICARGPCVMLEYNDNPASTAEVIDSQGWLHTGDLGSMDSRGYVTVTGRVKEMIIRGGENHFPSEIENCLLEHTGVAEVAVVGLPDEKYGEIIGAFIRPLGDGLTRSDLHAHCRSLMSPQKTPTVWVQVDSFPLTASGKIQKFALRDEFTNGSHEEIK